MRGIGIGVEVAEDAIQEMIQDILAVSEGVDDLNPVLTQLAVDIQNQMFTGRWTDRTSDLRYSIRAFVQDRTLTIRMLYYGYFLSFGTRDSSKTPLTAEVASAFPGKDVGSFFKQPDNNAGIAARRFYPTDIQELIANAMEAVVLQNLED